MIALNYHVKAVDSTIGLQLSINLRPQMMAGLVPNVGGGSSSTVSASSFALPHASAESTVGAGITVPPTTRSSPADNKKKKALQNQASAKLTQADTRLDELETLKEEVRTVEKADLCLV